MKKKKIFEKSLIGFVQVIIYTEIVMILCSNNERNMKKYFILFLWIGITDLFFASFSAWNAISPEKTQQKKIEILIRDFNLLSSEASGIRTPDNLIKSQVLYHLSYTPSFPFARKMPRTGIEPVTRGFSVLCSTDWAIWAYTLMCELREQDLNLRPSGYEPDELPSCSIPR